MPQFFDEVVQEDWFRDEIKLCFVRYRTKRKFREIGFLSSRNI